MEFNSGFKGLMETTPRAGIRQSNLIQIIPTANKFELLDKINDSSEKICLKRASIISSVTSIKSKKNVQIKNHRPSQKKRRNTNHGKSRQRIVLLGDSHTRKCASELQHNLGKDYKLQAL